VNWADLVDEEPLSSPENHIPSHPQKQKKSFASGSNEQQRKSFTSSNEQQQRKISTGKQGLGLQREDSQRIQREERNTSERREATQNQGHLRDHHQLQNRADSKWAHDLYDDTPNEDRKSSSAAGDKKLAGGPMKDKTSASKKKKGKVCWL
jgi:hypothetical protein